MSSSISRPIKQSADHAGSTRKILGIRVTDPETARVVAVHRPNRSIAGTGCVLSDNIILTCSHVVHSAMSGEDRKPRQEDMVSVRLIGVAPDEFFDAKVLKIGNDATDLKDLAILQLENPTFDLRIPSAVFATPLRHSGKSFSVLGFPDDSGQQGRSVTGTLHAADAAGLVQMDSGGALEVKGGFSGAPVWSPELGAFVGIVVSELEEQKLSWCIPSRILCQFYGDLAVRFRVPPSDRPHVNDYEEDDPNLDLFGLVTEDGNRRLEARVTERKNDYKVELIYRCLPGSPLPRGKYVTFITYPDFESDSEDAYELFSMVDSNGVAANEIYPEDLFTVAAVGDGGDTVLTIDLTQLPIKNGK